MQDPNFEQMTSERLIIRRFRPADAEAFAAYRNDQAVARYQSWEPPFSLSDAQSFIEAIRASTPGTAGEWFQFAVALAPGDELIGDFGLGVAEDGRQAELGFSFARQFQGKGYASEALRAILTYVFTTLALHRIYSITDVRNQPAQRLLERMAFRQEGRFIENAWFKGEWSSEVLYARLASEWRGDR